MKLTQIWTRATILLLGLCRFAHSEVMRPYHLDYLDADTMEYYLSAPKEDFDVAVLFYAQWCNNCHAFAPIWDQISRIHQAGTEQSKLIMGLFDCEENAIHSEICNKAGVKHYPTVSFFSLSGQKFSLRKPRHATQFGGNWQYGDAVYDWLKTMGGLSNWHRLGWGKKLRSAFFGKKQRPKDKMLPLGTPSQSAAASASAGPSGASGTRAAASGNTAALEAKVKQLEDQLQQYADMTTRSSVLLDAVLFPLSTGEYVVETDNNKNVTDVFHLLADSSGWSSTDPTDVILKTCVMEVSLDYCARLSAYVTNEWIATQEQDWDTVSEDLVEAAMAHLNQAVPESEPYCAIVEDCIMGDYAKEECRPQQCPFQDPAACRYLSACLSPEIQTEYAKALNLTDPSAGGDIFDATSGEADTEPVPSKPKGAWGL